MKRSRTNNIDIDKADVGINDLPPEILLEILSVLPKLQYPWKTLHFIFDVLKMTCKYWMEIIVSNEKIIYSELKISPLHFASAMNRDDEIVRLFLEEGYMLRAPDANGYSAACYATGNHAYKSMRKLKIAYALDTDYMSREKLLSFAPGDTHVEYLLQETNREYSFNDLNDMDKNFFDPNKKQFIEDFLTWNSPFKDVFIKSDLFKYAVMFNNINLLNDNPTNKLILYTYKNYIIKNFLESNSSLYEIDKIIKSCLECNINLNTCDERGNTLLHEASANPHCVHIVELLLKCPDININAKNIYSCTPLTSAIYNKNTDAVKLLIKYYHDKKSNFHENIPFYFIFSDDMYNYLKIFMDNGFIPTIQNLMVALCVILMKNTTKECVRIIADYLNINIPRINGNDPIYLSQLLEDSSTKKLLIRHGEFFMELMIKENLQNDLEIVLPNKKEWINHIPDISLRTPLCISAMWSNNQCIKLLLKYGAGVDAIDNCGFTPLHHAVESDNIDCVTTLLNADANINAQISTDEYYNENWTALHLATDDNNLAMVRLLLDRGADKNLITKLGLTAMDIAFNKNYVDIIAIL